MASYHFRIKSDKKADGSRVSTSIHVDYIARQGKYKNEGDDKNSTTNLISFVGEKNFGDNNVPLYLSDDFGKIYNTPQGLQVKGKYSPTTLAIALTLAKNISDNQPLILKGSKKFKDKILATAADAELNIKFADENLQLKFQNLLLAKKFENKILSDEQKNLAEQSANKILQNLDELKIQVSATSHFEYINREKAFKNRGDCIFTAHHLPSWAKDNPKNFFKAADKYEGKNRRRYVEIEFSLPNELTSIEDYKKIIDKFIDHHLKDHYFAYAIHDKIGNFSEGVRHPHCHIMFSERLIDDVEKIKERSPENFFKYPARKKRDGTEPSFQEKYVRGAPKNKKWNQNSKYVFQLREDFAKIQNAVLAEKGFSIRVDHRSLKAQRDNAIKNGDKFLAELLNRVPEKYLSSLPLDDNSPAVQALKKNRVDRSAHADELFIADFFSQKSAEEELAKKISTLTRDFFDLSLRDEFTYEKTIDIKNLKSEILDDIKEINSLRRLFVSTTDAQTQAKLQYMSKPDKKFFLQFQDTKSRRDNLQKFLNDFEKLSTDFKSSLEYQEIETAAKNKIKALDSNINMFQKFFDEVELKLQKPTVKKNINVATHNILQQNNFVRDKLQIALDKLNAANQKLRDEMPIAKPEQKVFDRDDFLNLLHRPYFRLSATRSSLNYKKMKLTEKLITLPRAKTMAENIFVRAELKKLQAKNFTPQQIRDFKIVRQDLRNLSKKKHKISPKVFNDQKKSLENELDNLKNICASADAQKKIFDIAIGILRKNKKFSVTISDLDNKIKNIDVQMQRLHKQMISAVANPPPRKFTQSNPVVDSILNKIKKPQEVTPQDIPAQKVSSTSTEHISKTSNLSSDTSENTKQIPPQLQLFIDVCKNVPPPGDLETTYWWISIAQKKIKAERNKLHTELNKEFSSLIDKAVQNSAEVKALEVTKNSLADKQKYYQDCKVKSQDLNIKLLELQNNPPQQFNFFHITTSEYKAWQKEVADTKHNLGRANDAERSASFSVEFARENIKKAEQALLHKRDSTQVSSPLLTSLESQLDELNKDLAYLNNFKSTVNASFRLTDTFKKIHKVNKKLSYEKQLSFDDIFAKSNYAKRNIKNFNTSPPVVRQMRQAEQAVKSSSGLFELVKTLTNPLWDTSHPIAAASLVDLSAIDWFMLSEEEKAELLRKLHRYD